MNEVKRKLAGALVAVLLAAFLVGLATYRATEDEISAVLIAFTAAAVASGVLYVRYRDTRVRNYLLTGQRRTERKVEALRSDVVAAAAQTAQVPERPAAAGSTKERSSQGQATPAARPEGATVGRASTPPPPGRSGWNGAAKALEVRGTAVLALRGTRIDRAMVDVVELAPASWRAKFDELTLLPEYFVIELRALRSGPWAGTDSSGGHELFETLQEVCKRCTERDIMVLVSRRDTVPDTETLKVQALGRDLESVFQHADVVDVPLTPAGAALRKLAIEGCAP